MGERFFALGVSFAVTVVVARYLGPADYGLLAYALSLTSLFAAAGHMGLSGLVVREIIKKPEQHAETLGTTLALKFLGMLIGYAGLVIYAAVYEGVNTTAYYLVLISGAALLIKPSEVISFWFEAFVKARYITLARISALTSASVLQFAFVVAGSSVTFFATASLLQAVIAAAILVILFNATSTIRLSDWRFSRERAKELLGQGWIIYLGSIFAVIYLKIDQVMLRWFAGAEEVGIYSIAAQLSEAWYFVPAAIVASFFPKLISLREENEKLFYKRLQQLFDALFIIALVVAVLMTVSAEWIIALFFGAHYSESAPILVIHIWAALFIFMRAAFSKWILIENALIFSLLTQGLGAVVNIVLNYFLIPEFGGQGAAYATLLSYAVASYFALLCYGKTRKVFWLMSRAFLSPVRYGYHFAKGDQFR